MVFKHARFVIYYRNGTTKPEDRTNPLSWDGSPKYEYLCQECGHKYPYFPEVPMDMCIKCAKDKEVSLVRQSSIIAMGIQFDPLPLEEDGDPVMSKEGNPLRVKFATFVLKGSSVYNYGWIQDKIAEQEFIGGSAHRVFGIRVGRVIDTEGHCECMVGHLAQGAPAIYSYYTTLHSLGIDRNARKKLHQLKLSECGKRIVTKKGEKIRQAIQLDLGERIEA